MVDYQNIPPLDDPANMFRLDGRVGLIAGGGGNMGRQFALVLTRAGAEVALADANETLCREAAEFVFDRTASLPFWAGCDVSDEQAVANLFSLIEDRYGRLDFFIANVMAKPVGYYRPFEEYPVETFRKVHEANLTGTFICCREAVKIMAKNNGGSIVITTSIYGLVAPDFRIYKDCSPVSNPYGGADPLTLPGAYASSKGGLLSLARYLAVLLAPKCIRVNTLTPGGVYDSQEAPFHQAYVDRTPLGRMAVWSDYNGAILFLTSQASRYMTGANLVMDGGWTTM